MMPPAPVALGSGSASASESRTIVDHEPIASEAEGDDPIDVVSVQTAASGPFVRQSPNSHMAGGKKYHCQRCLNHGLEIPRKGHKRECRYADCQCDDCKLVEKRKILNREINNERERVANSPAPDQNDKEANDIPAAKVRNPRCARCRAHDPDKEPPPLKGHKKACRYKNCECKRCSLITCRRDVMAKQIRLRRKQKSKSVSDNSESSSTTQSPFAAKRQAGSRSVSSTIACSPTSHACVDLVTPPAVESGPPKAAGSPFSPSDCDTDAAIAGVAVRPEPTYPVGVAHKQQPNADCCSPAELNNGGPIAGHPHLAGTHSPTAPYPDVVVPASLCPRSLFAGFLRYIQAVATAASSTLPGVGLTLPTLPATAMDHSALAGAAAVAFDPAALQMAHHARSPVVDACSAVPYFFPPPAPRVTAISQLAPFHQAAAHQHRCFVNDRHPYHQHPFPTTTAFVQGQPFSSLAHPHVFTLQ